MSIERPRRSQPQEDKIEKTAEVAKGILTLIIRIPLIKGLVERIFDVKNISKNKEQIVAEARSYTIFD
jgi:hypothetical protein